jgi:hypothetical protein
MNGLLTGVVIGVVGVLGAIRLLPPVVDKLLGPEDPTLKDSEDNPID